MISEQDKERVRAATDIVELVGETVELRQRGRDFWGCCPFHGEKTPSFHVMPDTGYFKCFGCGAGGDVFAYVMRREGLDFPDAIRYLADRAGIELEEDDQARRGPRKNRLVEALTEAEAYYHAQLMRGRGEGSAAARSYLAGRGMGSAVCRSWRLGFAPGHGSLVRHLQERGFTREELVAADLAQERSGRLQDRFYDRVMFPIHDERGRTIAFGGRVLVTSDRVAKYLNSRDTSVFNKGRHLFAYDRARETMASTGVAVVCEGYTDVIAMHEAGLTNAVAALGTALTADHVRLIDRQRVSRIVCLFDGDAAGQRAAERAVRFIDKTPAALLVTVLPDGQDPMEFLSTHDAAAMREQLEGAVPLMDFVFDKRLSGADLSTPGLRVRAMRGMAEVLAPLRGSIVLDRYATRLADALGFDVDEVRRAIREAPVPRDDERSGERGQGRASQGAQAGQGRSLRHPQGATGARAASPDEAMPAGAGRPMEAELELVSAIAHDVDAFRPHAERIAGLDWLDARDEAMVWAMLATPAGTPPKGVVDAAVGACPDARAVISSGRVAFEPGSDPARTARLLVDVCERYSLGRRIRALRARADGGIPDDEARRVLAEAGRLQARLAELGKGEPGVSQA